MLLGRSILESLIDMDVDSPTFGRALTVDAADSQGWHVSNWTSANEEWMALAALRVASAVQEVVGVVGSGAVVGGITGMVPYGEGQAPRRGCALRVAELAQLPYVPPIVVRSSCLELCESHILACAYGQCGRGAQYLPTWAVTYGFGATAVDRVRRRPTACFCCPVWGQL